MIEGEIKKRKNIKSKNADSNSLLFAKYKKVFLITMNHENAGFFCYLTFVINQLIYCEQHDYLPVVYFGSKSGEGKNAFYDPAYGENTWDYYFEPVAHYTYDDIKSMLDDIHHPLRNHDIIKLSTDELWYLHHENPNSIFNYSYGYYKNKHSISWYQEQRKKAQNYINQYIKIKSHIIEEVDNFYIKNFKEYRVLGVHMRGTDKGVANAMPHIMRIVQPKEYFPFIDKYTKENGYCKIFVATDQMQFLLQMRDRYKDRIIACDAIRSKSSLNPFQDNLGQNYKKGKDVLIDCLLLSRCDFLLKCTSAVGEYAMYFNSNLACIDLNYSKSGLKLINIIKVLRSRARLRYLSYCQLLEEKNRMTVSKKIILFLLHNFIFVAFYEKIEKHRDSRNPFWRILTCSKGLALRIYSLLRAL